MLLIEWKIMLVRFCMKIKKKKGSKTTLLI